MEYVLGFFGMFVCGIFFGYFMALSEKGYTINCKEDVPNEYIDSYDDYIMWEW